MGVKEDSDSFVLKTYNRFPLVFVKGQGSYLYTDKNEKFLDMASGIAVTSLGHAHPKHVKAVVDQAKELMHTSNYYYTKPYAELAKKLASKSLFDKVFFCNSGLEANECAIKLARRYGKKTGGSGKYEIITMKNSFHGRSMATLSATGQEKFHKGFEPILEGFKYIELNDEKELKKTFNKKTCAIMMEPIQGEGGIKPAFKEFIKLAWELSDKFDALLIFDEVQTGIGRTGKLFGYEHFLPVEPDVITLAKGLGGGLPIGACLLKEEFKDLLVPGDHASTFGGNPVVCAGANAVLDAILEEKLLENSTNMGAYFMEKLNDLKRNFKYITDVRGMGLLIGLEINFPAKELINKLIEEKIITVSAGDNVVRFLPPLNVGQREINTVLDALYKIFSKMDK